RNPPGERQDRLLDSVIIAARLAVVSRHMGNSACRYRRPCRPRIRGRGHCDYLAPQIDLTLTASGHWGQVLRCQLIVPRRYEIRPRQESVRDRSGPHLSLRRTRHAPAIPARYSRCVVAQPAPRLLLPVRAVTLA